MFNRELLNIIVWLDYFKDSHETAQAKNYDRNHLLEPRTPQPDNLPGL